MTLEEFLDRIDEIMCGTSNAERAYLADIYDEVTAPHWISVEDDGNPRDIGWYIFTTGKIVDVGYYLGDNEWRDVHPTHWMPLPQPPTVAKNATVKKGGEG